MMVNAPETPIQGEVIFVIETTAANRDFLSDLKINYIVPTLEYFHGGALEQGGGTGSIYCIVTYKTADSAPGLPVATYGPFTCPQTVLETVDKLDCIGGLSESRACVTEGLATAIACFEEIGRTDIPIHVVLLCCSPPFTAYGGGLAPPGVPATLEQAALVLCERGVHLSVICTRKILALQTLYEHAGGDLIQAQQRNYAKDPLHMVLLRGYSMKEPPPSPAPPPVPDIQADVYGQGRGQPAVPRPAAPPFPRAAVRGNWLTPPRQQIYNNNSALLTQLAQPPYPPPAIAPQTSGIQRLPNIMVAGPSTSSGGAPPAPLRRSYIWSGVLEWMEKGKGPGDQQKVTKHLPCQVSAHPKDIEAELGADTWPNKLLMQLMPKQLISNMGGQCLEDCKSVLFHLQPNETLDALTKVMVSGFAGCVHFQPMSMTPQCDIKVLILLYTPDRKAFLGFIPNNQATFVDRLKKVIQQQKMSQIMSKQLPTSVSGAPANMPQTAMPGASGSMPSAGMAGGSGMTGGGGMASGSMAPGNMAPGSMAPGNMAPGMPAMQPVGQMPVPGPSQPMQPQMTQHGQGMMMGGGMGGKGPRPVTQLDGLEAARQQNLEKIQHLQQTLEAAHQQEAQFKSQMDIMSQIHAAQAQELQYKQMEEQRKHQLQQQLQQQLRGAAGIPPRIMRPMMSSNPGLGHLLQQQQQGPRGSRPPHM